MKETENKITLKKIGQISLGFIGFISAALGIYAFFFQSQESELQYEIFSDTNVLDVNVDVNKLDILYNGNSLKATNQSMRIISFQVKNTGNTSILKSFYDDNDPLGITLNYGQIIEKPQLVNTSNSYIRKNLKLSYNSNFVSFGDVIIEPNDFFTIKLLVLYKNNRHPIIRSSGKIAGIKKIEVFSKLPESQSKESFWLKTFGGSIFSQLVRAVAYSFVVIFILVILLFIWTNVSENKSKKIKKKIIAKFKESDFYTFTPWEGKIFERFEKEGFFSLSLLNSDLKNEKEFLLKYNRWQRISEILGEDEHRNINYTRYTGSIENSNFDSLKEDGFLTDENPPKVNKQLSDLLSNFVNYVRDNYKLEKLY